MRDGIVVHAIGCADIKRTLKRGLANSNWIINVPDATDPATAVAADLNEGFGWPYEGSDEPAPWAPSDIKVLPCMKGSR